MTAEEARKIVVDAGIRLVREGLVARTWGNISQRIDEKHIAITPSGRPYELLTAEDIAILNIEDMSWEGRYKPSGERKLHAAIYADDINVKAVIHTHQTNASVCAAARKSIAVPEAYRSLLGDEVLCAPYGLPGSKKLTKGSAAAVKGRAAAFMANHGAVCIAGTMEQAFERAAALEKACEEVIREAFCRLYDVREWSPEILREYYVKDQCV